MLHVPVTGPPVTLQQQANKCMANRLYSKAQFILGFKARALSSHRASVQTVMATDIIRIYCCNTQTNEAIKLSQC